MCGITGAAWTDPKAALDPAVLQKMTDLLAHRGPDDRGTYVGHVENRPYPGTVCGAALGHRRLSIIDVAGGHQPISNEDGAVWVSFNGEIYNYAVLQKRLEGSGHRLRTASDTEVLVHLYEDEGVDFLRHVNGMFALAIWDRRRRELLLARDRLGQKPLYYRVEPYRLLFASQLKSLLAVPGVEREIDPGALDEYLTYQYVPHPNTIFRGIRKLPPGHYALYRDGELTVSPYWEPDFEQEVDRDAQAYAGDLRQALTSAVQLRLQSEVPLGAFLSGGVDSSIIVGLMRQLTGERIKTFSIGFPVPEYDETEYAREVARHFDTDHEEFRVEPDAVEILPQLAWHFDEPMADSSAIPTWYVSQLTRQHVTVALTGDGGDELFSGYPRYRAVRMASALDRLPRDLRRLLTARLWQSLPGNRQKSLLRRWRRFTGSLAMSPTARYLDWIAIFNLNRRAQLYDDGFLEQLPGVDPQTFLTRAISRCKGRDPVTTAALCDLVTYLPCDLMTKVDTASMAHGLECRQPFLDHRVVELAAAMPGRLKFRGLRGKRILVETFADLLPRRIRRRPKMGFGVPLDHWFRHELRDFLRDVLLDHRAAERGYFRPGAVRQLVDEHQDGHFDHSYRLWALLFFELWARQWVDQPPTTGAGIVETSNSGITDQ